MTRHVQPIGIRLLPDGTVDSPPQPAIKLVRGASFTQGVNSIPVGLDTVGLNTDPAQVGNLGGSLDQVKIRAPGLYLVTAALRVQCQKLDTTGSLVGIETFLNGNNGSGRFVIQNYRTSTVVLVTGPSNWDFMHYIVTPLLCVPWGSPAGPNWQAFDYTHVFFGCQQIFINSVGTYLSFVRLTSYEGL